MQSGSALTTLTPHNHALRIMYATVFVDQVAFGFQYSQNLYGLFEASGALQDRAYNLAIGAAWFGHDRAIVFSLPSGGQVRNLDAPVASTNAQLAPRHQGGGYGRFDLQVMRSSALNRLCGLPDYAEHARVGPRFSLGSAFGMAHVYSA